MRRKRVVYNFETTRNLTIGTDPNARQIQMIAGEFVEIASIVEIGVDDAAIVLTGCDQNGGLPAKQEIVRVRRKESKWLSGSRQCARSQSKTDQYPPHFQK